MTKPNKKQNKQVADARQEIKKRWGRDFTEKEIEEFHDLVTKQGYDYHEMVEEGYWLNQGQIPHGN